MTDDDKVGYKRPPKATQFQKGKSGNPQGRPKGTRNLKTDLAEELASPVTITVRGKAARVSKQKALIMAITNNALKGDTRATMVVVNLVRQLLDPGVQLDEAIIATFSNGPGNYQGLSGPVRRESQG